MASHTAFKLALEVIRIQTLARDGQNLVSGWEVELATGRTAFARFVVTADAQFWRRPCWLFGDMDDDA